MTKEENEEKENKELLDELKMIRQYSEQTFDKQLVYIAGGGLILTLGFVKDVVDLSKSSSNWLLFLTWILLTLALTLNLFSHRSAKTAVDHYIKDNTTKGVFWNNVTDKLGIASAVSLFLGITSFIIFIILNI